MPDLKPERAWSGEVGLDAAKGSDLRLSFSAFIRQAEDLIDWARGVGAPSGSPWETRNVEEATFKGLEADLVAQGPWETRWSLGGMVLSVDSRESTGFESKYALRPLEQRLRIGAGRSFWETVTLDLNVQRARRRGEESYHRLDIRAGFRVGSGRLYLDANNLLDAHYPDVTGALAPGRAIFLGWQWGGGAGEG